MSKNRPDRSRLKIEGIQNAIKATPPDLNTGNNNPEPLADLHQWGEPPEWPTLQPWGDWYKRPWQKPEW